MVWSEYRYLVVVLLAALLVLYWVFRHLDSLRQASERRTREEIALIVLASAVGLAAVYGRIYAQKVGFAFGVGDISTDVIDQYVPFYTNLVEHIQSGAFGSWNFDYGLGVNLPSYQTWLYDPFNLVLIPLVLVLGIGRLSLSLALTQSVKVLVSALLFDHLLTRYCRMPLARAAASVLYAFSSFLMLLGQHFFLGSLFPMLTLAVLCYELYLERQCVRSFLCVTGSVAAVLLWSAYIAWMVLLFCAMYLLLRMLYVLEGRGPRAFFRTLGLMFLPVACGVLLSGVLLVPYALFLTQETARTSSDASMAQKVLSHLGFVNADWVGAILSRLLGGSLINDGWSTEQMVSDLADVSYAGSFSQEFIQLGYSCAALMLLSQFAHWVATEVGGRARALIVASAALVLLYCFNQFLPTLFTAMVRFQYRSSAIVAVPACIALAVAIEKRVACGKVAFVPLAVSALLTLVIIAWSMRHAVTGKLPSAVFAAGAVAAFAALVAGRKFPAFEGAATVAFIGVAVATTFFDGFYCTNNRGLVPISDFPYTQGAEADADTRSALSSLLDSDTSMYRVEKTYHDHSLASDSLLQGYAGASQYNSTLDADLLEFYDKLWPEATCSWLVYTQMYTTDAGVDPAVLNLLGVRYVLSRDALDLPWMELAEQEDGVLIYEVAGSDSFLTVRGSVVSESDADALGSAGERRALLADAVIVPDDVAKAYDGKLGGSGVCSSVTQSGAGELSGTVSVDGAAAACLPVPHTGTWHVYVDGEEVETFRADYGFVGFVVEPGEHEFTAVYQTEGASTGAMLSVAGAVVTAVCAIALWRVDKKRVSAVPA
ncbi:MAG: YfhO family protein [Coriobacteriia bacterium]|nr:YfhO family protein [Coriobacteriia bacterium]